VAFDAPELPSQLRWQAEPARWSIEPVRNCLRIEPDAGTDFWQKTHYKIEADTGHFLFAEIAGDFVLTARVHFQPVCQFDQAGLMVRLSPTCWLKASVEHELDGPSRLGAVVTNQGYSDWSTQDFPAAERRIAFRIHRQGGDYLVEASRESQGWKQIRLAHLQEDQVGGTIRAGLYACSPKGAGMIAEFESLRIDKGED
jgi:regulation of enolase protein 1 (concanavalin A-like superfamily)